jgi:AsmA protein
MKRISVVSRLRKLAVAALACLLFAVLVPMYFSERRDEPFAISSVLASPRDLLTITAPVRLSNAPDIVLNRGVVYGYGSTAQSGAISNIVLEGPVFTLNAAGLRATTTGSTGPSVAESGPVGTLVEHLMSLGFDLLTIRRGTLHVTAFDGSLETIGDIQAEVTGLRKGQVASRGSFTVRGQRVVFDATMGQPADKRTPHRWPLKASLKSGLLQASLDGHANVAEDLQVTGPAEVSTPSLRRLARWFGLPLYVTEGFNATVIKGDLTWANRSLVFEKAKVSVDGNEANGRIALHLGGDRPLADATLDFASLNLTPYAEATRTQFFGFEIPSGSWSTFDFSLPLIRHVDADLRISARKVVFKGLSFGQSGATITTRAGKLQADITEVELTSGTASAQVTAIMSESMPRYALRAKLENVEVGPAGMQLLGATPLAGRATMAIELTSSGYTGPEIVGRMSGKADLKMSEGGRLALDVRALHETAKMRGAYRGWSAFAKANSGIDRLEARALIIDGIAFAEELHARAGTMGIAASGRLGLGDGNMEMRVVLKSNVPADRPLTHAELMGGEMVSVRGPWHEPLVRGEDADTVMPPR